MTPSPPSRAIVTAVRHSVTVSIARGDDRNVERELARQASARVRVSREEVGVPGHEQDVVERQGFVQSVLDHGVPPASIARGPRAPAGLGAEPSTRRGKGSAPWRVGSRVIGCAP